MFTSYGVRIGVRTNDPEILPDLVSRLPHRAKLVRGRWVDHLFSVKVAQAPPKRKKAGTRRRVRQFNILYADAAMHSRKLELPPVLSAFATETQLRVAENSPRGIFLHCGAVGWKGRALLLPGSSHAGKSTLVHELVRQGAKYFSDEYAILDDSGRVLPYARPLALRPEGAREVVTPERKLSVEIPEGSTARRRLPVGLVAALRYEEGAVWAARRQGPGQGFLNMMESAVPARSRPAETMSALRSVCENAVFIKGKRGEAAEAAERLLDRMERLPSDHRGG